MTLNSSLQCAELNGNSSRCDDDTNDDSASFVTVTKIVFSVIELILMVAILTGNSLTIVAVKKFSQLQTKANQFLISLCGADLLVGCVMPFHAAFFLTDKLRSNRWACIIRYMTILLSCSASIFNLLVIAVDRYVAIVYPLRYHAIVTNRLVNLLTAAVWVYATIIGGIPLVWNNWYPGQKCRFEDVVTWQYLWFVLTVQYVIISSIMLALYGRIFQVAADHQRRIQEMFRVGENNHAASAQRDMKHAKLLALVMGVFLMCWTPLFVTLPIIYSLDTQTIRATDVRNVCTFLGIFNSCMNPLIYAWKNSDFRVAFVKLLHLDTCSRQLESNDPEVVNGGSRIVPTTSNNNSPDRVCHDNLAFDDGQQPPNEQPTPLFA